MPSSSSSHHGKQRRGAQGAGGLGPAALGRGKREWRPRGTCSPPRFGPRCSETAAPRRSVVGGRRCCGSDVVERNGGQGVGEKGEEQEEIPVRPLPWAGVVLWTVLHGGGWRRPRNARRRRYGARREGAGGGGRCGGVRECRRGPFIDPVRRWGGGGRRAVRGAFNGAPAACGHRGAVCGQ